MKHKVFGFFTPVNTPYHRNLTNEVEKRFKQFLKEEKDEEKQEGTAATE